MATNRIIVTVESSEKAQEIEEFILNTFGEITRENIEVCDEEGEVYIDSHLLDVDLKNKRMRPTL